MTIILRGDPRTKKNSQRLVPVGGRMIPITSRAFADYQEDCLRQITGDKRKGIDCPVNVRCVYYMATRRKVDLTNLLEATDDILVKAGVLKDDNCTIISSHDGSRVLYDRRNPRVDITIDWTGVHDEQF